MPVRDRYCSTSAATSALMSSPCPLRPRNLEVEIRPAGATARKTAGGPSTTEPGGHHHGPGHDHHDHGPDDQLTSAFPHVGVVGRPVPGGVHFTLGYPHVVTGDYELCPIPGGRVALTVFVVGGEVTEVDWPA